MKNIIAIFQKQIKDTLKNKSVLIEFLIFPIMSIIMEYSIHIEGMPEHFLQICLRQCMWEWRLWLPCRQSFLRKKKKYPSGTFDVKCKAGRIFNWRRLLHMDNLHDGKLCDWYFRRL